MSDFRERFQSGTESWTEATQGQDTVDVSRSILASVSHEGAVFRGVDFSGSTIKNCYFTNCEFINCVFRSCAFENCTFTDSSISSARLESLEVIDCTLIRLYAAKLVGSSLSVQRGRIENSGIEDASLGTLSLKGCSSIGLELKSSRVTSVHVSESRLEKLALVELKGMTIVITTCTGSLVLDDSTAQKMHIREKSSLMCNCVDSHVLACSLSSLSEKIIVAARNSFLVGVDLRLVDLGTSSFVATALVDCTWPSQVGTTTWYGRVRSAPNLIAQPANDIAGLSESLRKTIHREQALKHLEEESKRSVSTLLLHRVVGATTGHGRSPLRLMLSSFVMAALLTLANALVRGYEVREAVQGSPIASQIAALFTDCVGFWGLIVGVGNRSELGLVPELEVLASVASFVFIGLLVTVLTNFLFRQQ